MMGPRRFALLLAAVAALLSGCASAPQHYSAGYTQTGLASWYGSEQGHETSSGERFNPRELTAAHRHFPFGSIARVTNRENGRSVDVRINDRGPWTDDDRIIDLSSAAADVLQMKRSGVVPVDVELLSVGDGRRCHED